jgi:polar amino acid transport system substrate-binding protein
VAAVQGSYNEAQIRKLAPQARVLVFQEYPQAFLAMKQGLADAFTTIVTILQSVTKKDPDYEIVGDFLTSEPIAFGVRQNDSQWRDTLNFALQDMDADGTYKHIFERYFDFPYQPLEKWAP